MLDLSAYGRETKLAHKETNRNCIRNIEIFVNFSSVFYLLSEKKDKLFVTHLRCHPCFVWIVKPVSIPVMSINQSRCCSFNVILVNQWNSEFRFWTHESEILDSCDQRPPPPFFLLPNPSRASGTQGIMRYAAPQNKIRQKNKSALKHVGLEFFVGSVKSI